SLPYTSGQPRGPLYAAATHGEGTHMTDRADWHLQSIFHFTVNATNFERSLDFYTTLGFRVLRDNRNVDWPPSLAVQFGMNQAKGRGALLGIGDGPEHTRLDLLEWLAPPYDPAPAGVAQADRVPRIMAL